MSTKLIFNSEENYSNSLCIVLDDDINKSFIFDKITITNILDQYIELDLYTDDIILIDKLEILLKNIKEEKLKSPEGGTALIEAFNFSYSGVKATPSVATTSFG